MSSGGGPGLSAVKLALQGRQRRAESIAALRADPVAIIGMACRMPGGADSPDALWSLLSAGRTTVGPVPQDRWDAAAWHHPDVSAPGKSVTCEGSFLQPADGHGIDEFDAAYFGIAAREADRMDPQQRLLLEVAYEALDDAGIDQRALAGSRSGVFIGSYHDDYTQLQAGMPESIELRTLTGTLQSVLASRISYLLDLRGPALAVDTACSSSLVAIHLACQSLRWGETDMALAGGVSLMLTPALMVMMSKVGFMAPDGRSKTFDAAADGFGRGEGCGVLVLRRLADAIAAGDRIWAVIRGSAVNQDGRSTLLTAPNGPAQEAMIREALAAAQLQPSRIGYVETHGTGTALGDPVEVEAVAAVLGRPEAEAGPCWLGAIKANLGHLEAAAGVAGVMKAALALRHRAIPPQPALTALNPHIRLEGTRLAIPTTLIPWEAAAGEHPRCAAVSAFGVGGTNAHVILEEAPVVPLPGQSPGAGTDAAAWLLPLSAKSAAALAARAKDFVRFLDADSASIADLCHSAARRTPCAHRLAVVGKERWELARALRQWLEQSELAPDAPAGPKPASGVVFVFAGQAPPWFAMGRELLQAEPVFRECFMAVEALLSRLAGWSLAEKLAGAAESDGALQAAVAQPALFALQLALAALWQSWGVEPDALVGQGVGELAALQVAGALDLEDAVRLVLQQGRVTQDARGAARFDPGCDAPLLELGAGWQSRHPRIPVFSSVTGARAEGPFDAHYFARLPETLRFADAMLALPAGMAFLELGPHPILSRSIAAGREQAGRAAPAIVASSLRRGSPVRETMLRAAAMLFAAGALKTPALVQPARGRIVSLPAYPWQRQSHWLPPPPAPSPSAPSPSAFAPWPFAPSPRTAAAAARQPTQGSGHPLLGTGIQIAGSDARLYLASPERARAWLDQHRVLGRLIVPGAAVMEAFLAAANEVLEEPASLVDFAIHRPIEVRETAPDWQIMVHAPAGDRQDRATTPDRSPAGEHARAGITGHIELAWFETTGVAADAGRCVASARAQRAAPRAAPLPQPAPAVTLAPIGEDSLYARFAALGVEFGPHFRLLTHLMRAPGSASATVTLPARVDGTGFELHPVLLDAAVQLCSVAGGSEPNGSIPQDLYLPIGAEQITVWPPMAGAWQRQALRLHAQLYTEVKDGLVGDVTVYMPDGTCVAQLKRLRLALANRSALEDLPLYEPAWECLPPAETAPAAGSYLLFTGDADLAQTLAANLAGLLLWVAPGSAYARPAENVWQIDFTDPAQLRRLLQEADWQGGTIVHAASLADSEGDLRNSGNELRDSGVIPRDPAGNLRDSMGEPRNSTEEPRDSMAALHDAMGEPRDSLSEPPPVVDTASLALLLHLVQADPAGRMVVVTRGAQTVGDEEPLTGLCPQAAPLWGLAGVIRAEEPSLRLRTIDLDPAASGAAGLLAELLASDAAPAVAVRGALRWRPMLQRHALLRDRSAARGRRLIVRRPGTFDGLEWEDLADTAPAAGEVRLRVHAAGLNFRDVLLTLGLYPGAPLPLGGECAGVVQAVGPGVSLTVGQRVFGCATACLAGSATVPAAFLAVMPERLGMVEAAALPVAFLTAMYGLNRLAGLRAGERVLIHAATGGVGLAAVQLAQRAGAQVFATAGSPAKRSLLRALGVTLVMDSRSVTFADEVLAATGGRGVDVVLNSLTGEFIPAGLRALAQRGRFLELGKRGVWSAEQMAAARPDVAYFLYDLGAAAAADHDLLPPLYAELLAALADGSLRPLPVAEFPVSAAAQALRTMAQARHVGKLVLRIADETPRPMPRLRPEATYWITGGLSGMGLETADWLVAQGARQLLLSGRGAPSPAARARIAALESRGARIVVEQADAADAAAMARIMDAIDAAHPLRGVVHAAGTLHDGMLAHQEWPRAQAVLRGKLFGAWTLHRLTERVPLDFFVLYSAAAAVLGAPGQGLYPAANAGLDALAYHRRRLGLPALCVAWGLWAGVGMAARLTGQAADAWSGRGLRPIDPASGFAALERLLAHDTRHAIVLPIDWPRFLATLPAGLDRDFFAHVGRNIASAKFAPRADRTHTAHTTHAAGSSAPGIAHLHDLPPRERRAALLALLRERTLALIGLDPATPVDPRQPLKDLGLDSLMAVELRNVLIHEGGTRLPATLLFDYPSLDGLAGHLMTVWDLTVAEAAARSSGAITSDVVTAMSEAEAEALLLAELGTGGGQ